MIRARYQPPARPPSRGGGPDDGEGGRPGPFRDWLRERLLEKRIIVVRGRLGPEEASELAAQVVALDAAGQEPIEVHVDCPDAELGSALLLLDTLHTARSPVHVTAVGQVGGAALGLLTVAARRVAFPHARFRMVEPRAELAGTAQQVVSGASQHLQLLESLIVRLADLTGQPRHRIEDDLTEGRFLTAEQAVQYGLVDEVRGREPGPGRGRAG